MGDFLVHMRYLALLLLFSLGCQETEPIPDDIVSKPIRNRKANRPETYFNVSKFSYDDHKYIEFNPTNLHGTTVVHDPDCPCHK